MTGWMMDRFVNQWSWWTYWWRHWLIHGFSVVLVDWFISELIQLCREPMEIWLTVLFVCFLAGCNVGALGIVMEIRVDHPAAETHQHLWFESSERSLWVSARCRFCWRRALRCFNSCEFHMGLLGCSTFSVLAVQLGLDKTMPYSLSQHLSGEPLQFLMVVKAISRAAQLLSLASLTPVVLRGWGAVVASSHCASSCFLKTSLVKLENVWRGRNA